MDWANVFNCVTLLSLLNVTGCASAPPAVGQLHAMEIEAIVELRRSHLALVDVYAQSKLDLLEVFFLDHYAPQFREHWVEAFQTTTGKLYRADRDFTLLQTDLMAEFQELSQPVYDSRAALRDAVASAYEQVFLSHAAVGKWIGATARLEGTREEAVDNLLNAVRPGLSVGDLEVAAQNVMDKMLPVVPEIPVVDKNKK